MSSYTKRKKRYNREMRMHDNCANDAVSPAVLKKEADKRFKQIARFRANMRENPEAMEKFKTENPEQFKVFFPNDG